MSNTGFVDAVTVLAAAASRTLSLGTFAALAGPAVATDGTVFLGTREGTVIALHADGRVYWDRQLADGETIVTSPAVGSDGSVYVVGVRERWS
jgi:outer membrane protein assembly factor BamB